MLLRTLLEKQLLDIKNTLFGNFVIVRAMPYDAIIYMQTVLGNLHDENPITIKFGCSHFSLVDRKGKQILNITHVLPK